MREAVPSSGALGLARLEAFFASDYQGLLRFACLIAGDDQAAEDLVQEAFVRLWRASRRIQPQDLGAYARRTIVNLARSRHRRELVTRRHLPRLAAEPIASGTDHGDRAELWEAVCALSPRERACVVLRFYEDLTERDTAEVLGISTGAVKKMMNRAMGKLRATLGDRRSDES